MAEAEAPEISSSQEPEPARPPFTATAINIMILNEG
jgi:hypothetical protein